MNEYQNFINLKAEEMYADFKQRFEAEGSPPDMTRQIFLIGLYQTFLLAKESEEADVRAKYVKRFADQAIDEFHIALCKASETAIKIAKAALLSLMVLGAVPLHAQAQSLQGSASCTIIQADDDTNTSRTITQEALSPMDGWENENG